MHDIKKIREESSRKEIVESLNRRSSRDQRGTINHLLDLDRKYREKIASFEELVHQKKKISFQIGQAKAKGDNEEFENLKESLKSFSDRYLKLQKNYLETLRTAVKNLMLEIPNIVSWDTPDGEKSVEIRRSGPVPEFDFPPLEHFNIPGVRKGMDFETAANLSGSRFSLLFGALARIHRALSQFMIDCHVDHNGFQEVWVPVLVKEEMMVGTGQLPRFIRDSYQTFSGLWLIPTGEVPLSNLVRDKILSSDYFPGRYVAHTQCFRLEAGSPGKDTIGMMRQHQFEKVEMVSIVSPEDSEREHERIVAAAEKILDLLGLHCRTVVLGAKDLGFSAAKTYDIEVWLPGQGKFREISSVSNCLDFQARRMNARFRPAPEQPTEFVHTLNGSGLAVGRSLIAVLEQGQRKDGSVELPEVLSKYLNGHHTLSPDGNLC